MKYYRIKKLTLNNGDISFQVESCNNLFNRIIDEWYSYWTYHDSFDEAMDAIKLLHGSSVETMEVIYKTNSKELKKND